MSEREGEKTNETSAECDELVAEYKEKVTLRVEKRIQKGIFCSLIAPETKNELAAGKQNTRIIIIIIIIVAKEEEEEEEEQTEINAHRYLSTYPRL